MKIKLQIIKTLNLTQRGQIWLLFLSVTKERIYGTNLCFLQLIIGIFVVGVWKIFASYPNSVVNNTNLSDQKINNNLLNTYKAEKKFKCIRYNSFNIFNR